MGKLTHTARGCLTNEETFRIVRVARIARMISYQNRRPMQLPP